jgi:hypothetical protein
MVTVIIPHVQSSPRFLGRPRLLTRMEPLPRGNPRHDVPTLNEACQRTGAGDAETSVFSEAQDC